MAKKSKLLRALDAHKGRDYEVEKKKKQLKAGEKRSRQKIIRALSAENNEDDGHEQLRHELEEKLKDDFAGFSESSPDASANEHEESEGESVIMESNGKTYIIPQPDIEPEASASEAEQEEDVPLSEVSLSEDEDIVPHQRLTINNVAALSAARSRVSIVRPKMHLQAHNSLISTLPPASSVVNDPNDDIIREEEFYKIAKEAASSAKVMLIRAGVSFTRPNDYFAEMVKTDEHMGRVKKKIYDEAAGKKAAAEARAMRDAKKYGKKVQLAKEAERAREKRETLDKIKDLKRKRKGQDTGKVNEDEDLFQSIDVEAESNKDRSGRERGGDADGRTFKRPRTEKDKKYGHGGKKRFAKSGDAISSSDMKGFSVGRMKGRPRGGGSSGGGRGGSNRPGKARRAAAR